MSSSRRKVLVLVPDESVKDYILKQDGIKAIFEECHSVTWSTNMDFRSAADTGNHYDTYDFVFAYVGDKLGGEYEEITKYEMIEYYSSAPIFYAFNDGQNECDMFDGEKCFEKVVVKNGPLSQQVPDAFIEATETYESLLNNDVKVAFNNFDTDGSGGIDKKELGELSKKLGNELTEKDLDEALKTLDLNGDGVIDIHEFARWYFSGMKSFGSFKRSLFKV